MAGVGSRTGGRSEREMDSSTPAGSLRLGSGVPTPPRSEMDDSDGSEDEGIICEETLADTPPYSFRITLGRHYDYESVVTILSSSSFLSSQVLEGPCALS